MTEIALVTGGTGGIGRAICRRLVQAGYAVVAGDVSVESGPGERFRYSDINFILLGALIEKVTGEDEDVYVQQNVFAPLGMEDTRYLLGSEE